MLTIWVLGNIDIKNGSILLVKITQALGWGMLQSYWLFPGREVAEAFDSACKDLILPYCVINKKMKKGLLFAFESYFPYSLELLPSLFVIMHSSAKA